jgi:hypothetical protein
MVKETKQPPGGFTSGRDEALRFDFDFSSTLPSAAVVESVATARDTTPESLPLLYESVDPDALNDLVGSSAPTPETVSITFTFDDVTVTVHGTGEVVVRTDAPI